jgi:NAD(P)-dependent dehydrogenase (short-subunit alcohol dehydrogenase family)
MSMVSKQKAVLITGTSSGIGEATARRLAQGGYRVYATARKVEAIAVLKAAGCKTIVLDVTDEASMKAAIAAIEAQEGSVDVLINNAGYSQSGALEMLSIDSVRRQFETNVFGLLRLTQLVLPGMRAQRKGRIINISSMGGELTFPGGGAYHATKHAIEALSDALRFEVEGFGIDVIVIQPGLITTGFSDAALRSMDHGERSDPYAEFDAAVAKATKEAYEKGPLLRLGGTPDDVARKIQIAIEAKRPKARYTVSASATVMMTLRRLVSDRMWDRFLAGTYPRPK